MSFYGIRTSKTVNGVKHEYTLDGTNIVKETWDGNTLIPLYDNTESVCGITYNGTSYYFLKNLQGDVIAITDYTGTVVARYTYDAWGICTIESDTTDCNIAEINPYRYRTYYLDQEIGMYYLQSRYYDVELGRFVNGDDPAMTCMVQGKVTHNMYSYCQNNTVIHKDESGYVASNVIGAIIGGIIGAIGGYVLTNWLANRLNLKGWKRNLFVWGLTALIGAAAAAIGYFVGPYVAKAWNALLAKLSGLVKGSFKSIQNITSSKMKHINTAEHLWKDILGKQTNNVNIKNLIYKAVRKGEWKILDSGTIGIHWKYAGKLIEITGNVVNGVFKIGNAWVWNGVKKLLF